MPAVSGEGMRAWGRLAVVVACSSSKPASPNDAGLPAGDVPAVTGWPCGEDAAPDRWDTYQGWWKVGRPPVITMIEVTPPDRNSYGYGHEAMKVIPKGTLEFGHTLWPMDP